jgi:hypothetical protein
MDTNRQSQLTSATHATDRRKIEIRLSSNPNAIHILEKNLDKIDWGLLSMNHNIFENTL